MMTPDEMELLYQALLQRGYPEATADDYAIRLGDAIEVDDAGKWVIRDDQGAVIDRIAPVNLVP